MSIGEKKDLLARYDNLPKMSQREAAFKLGIQQATLCRLLKNRHDVEGASSSQDSRKHARTGHCPEVDAAILRWIRASWENGTILSGSLVMTKADEFAAELGLQDKFRANEGWLNRLKKRSGLVHKKLHGEEASADIELRDSEDEYEESPPSISQMRAAMATLRKGLLHRGFEQFALLDQFEGAMNECVAVAKLNRSDRYFSSVAKE